ncbi:MAG: class I SAM-dependent methyltransferase [Pseudomonadota bacterium]
MADAARPAIDPDTVKGFLHPEEADALAAIALEQGASGPAVEIGSYCGKSALITGSALKAVGGVLFAVDHHRGSEENQPGWQYHDPDLWDEEAGALDTLPEFRRTIRRSGLEGAVVALVGPSALVAQHWRTPLSFLFIDGGHTMEAALNDYRLWTPHLAPGGVLAIHDVFPNPEDGGRPPFEIYQLAKASGLYEDLGMVRSLARFRRIGAA